MGIDFHRLEIAALQSAAMHHEARQSRIDPLADAAGGGEFRKDQGLFGFHGSAERKVTVVKPRLCSRSSSRGSTSRTTGAPPAARAAWPSCSNRISPACSGA